MSVNEKMTAIANNIRSKTGKTEPLNLDDMANGVNEVYEAGKKTKNEEFFDKYLNLDDVSVTSTNHESLFSGLGWNNDTFYPTKDISVGYGYKMFYRNRVTNIRQRLIDCGVKLDFTTANDTGMMFESCKSTELPTIELHHPNLVVGQTQRLCYNCTSLVTIEKIIAVESNLWGNSFTGCSALQNITIEGVIGKTISFSSSPLTVESMKSIITHLKKYAGTQEAGNYTLTLKDSCKTLMEEQGAIEELGGKTYDAYIADIGWNLA